MKEKVGNKLDIFNIVKERKRHAPRLGGIFFVLRVL